MRNIFKTAAAACAAVGVFAMSAPAMAQDVERFGARIGFLNCAVEGGFGFIFGSSREIACTFSGLGGQVIERYEGRINTFGIDIGYRTNGVMIWGVFAPTGDVDGTGVLAGTYAGVGANVALGLGFGGRVMVGGLDESIALQPFSIEGVAGINVAGGIMGMRLESVPLN